MRTCWGLLWAVLPGVPEAASNLHSKGICAEAPCWECIQHESCFATISLHKHCRWRPNTNERACARAIHDILQLVLMAIELLQDQSITVNHVHMPITIHKDEAEQYIKLDLLVPCKAANSAPCCHSVGAH